MYRRSPIRRVSGWGIQQGVDRAGEGGPLTALLLPDPLTARCEPVIPPLATILWSFPMACHQTLLFQMAKDGINRAIEPVQRALRSFEDSFADVREIKRRPSPVDAVQDNRD
jgi:hypothetical protein